MGYSLSGGIEGDPFGTVTLVVNGDVVAGEVRLRGATYTVRSTGGVVEIRETDPATLPPGAEPERPAPAADEAVPAGAAAAVRDLPEADLQAASGLSEIDVLVVYTAAAREAAGGEAEIEADIDLWVAATNGYYLDSGVQQRIRLAHTEELDYVEDQSIYDLGALREKGDGLMDEVHAMRDAVGADLVHLVERWGVKGAVRNCGRAYLMTDVGPGFRSWAFGATTLSCGSLTFAHELGHNMGLNHDRYVEDLDLEGGLRNTPHVHAYGYVNQPGLAAGAPASSRWRTIMAYSTQCEHLGTDCPRVGRFSNPAQEYVDDPVGVWRNGNAGAVTGPADAVSTLNETRSTVASFKTWSRGPRVVSLKRRLPAKRRTNSDTPTWRLAFNRDVENVTDDDFVFSGSGLAGATPTVTAKAGSRRIYDIAAAGVADFDGSVTLGFSPRQDIRSLAGHPLLTTRPAYGQRSYTLDNTAPTPSLSPSSAGGSPFVATIRFAEDVSGFDEAGDVAATGASVTAPARSDARTYTVQVTPASSAAGTVSLSVPAAAATDLAGNPSVAASADVAWDPSNGASLTVSGLSNASVSENARWTSAAPSVGGSPSGTVSWTMEGVDAALFTIHSRTGVLRLPARNFERPEDADADNRYEVTARVTDASGNSAAAAVTVSVTDVNESRSVQVRGASSRKVPDGLDYSSHAWLDCSIPCWVAGGAAEPVSWTKSGADAALFTLDSATGALSPGQPGTSMRRRTRTGTTRTG